MRTQRLSTTNLTAANAKAESVHAELRPTCTTLKWDISWMRRPPCVLKPVSPAFQYSGHRWIVKRLHTNRQRE
jgi:hypothetical protein